MAHEISQSIRKQSSKKPDKLVYKVTMLTLMTINIIFAYDLIIRLIAPNISPQQRFIINIICICLVIDLAACLILYRYQHYLDLIDEEIDKRHQTEEALRQANDVLENQVKKRIRELEQNNKELHIEIMEREQVEENLRESEEKYRLLVNSMPGTVFRGYMDWTVDFFDNKVEELTGYKRRDFDSKKITWDSVILKDDLKEVKKQFLEALKTDRIICQGIPDK